MMFLLEVLIGVLSIVLLSVGMVCIYIGMHCFNAAINAPMKKVNDE